MSDAQMFNEIKESIISLDEQRAKKLTQEALAGGISPQDIISKGLMEGMIVIGEGFERHDLYLPELMLSGKVMQSALSILQPHLKENSVKSAGKVVLGTVEGDIHDIGKNIVGGLLEGNGFEVHDVGIDVPVKVFAEKAREVEADVVALSALLSGAVSKFVQTIMDLKENNIQAKIIIGGAAANQNAAEEMGADAYGKNAWDGVQKIKQLIATGRSK